MGNNEIQSWLDQARKAGISDIHIHEQLKKSGWSDSQVASALGVQQIAPAIAEQIPPKRKMHIGIIVGIFAGVIVVLGAGTVFASWKGFLPFRIPYLGTEVEHYLKTVGTKIKDYNAGEWGFTISLKNEAKTITDGSIFTVSNNIDKSISGTSDLSSTVDSIDPPKDLAVSGNISIYIKNINKPTVSGYGTLSGSYTGDGTTYKVNLEVRVPGNKFLYLVVHEFPHIASYSLDSIKEKWISYNIGDLSNTLEDFSVSKDEQKKLDAQSKKLDDEINAMGVIGVKTGFVSMKFSGSETLSGQQTKIILITLNPKKIDAFTKAYRKDIAKRKGDITQVSAFLKILEEKTKRTSLTQLLGTSTLKLWINDKTRYPAKVELSTAVVSPEKTSKAQLRFVVGATISHINENLPIEVPKDTITIEEATSSVMSEIMGLTSPEDVKFEKQVGYLSDIGTALDNYNSLNGAYPETLDSLLQEPPKTNTNSNTNTGSINTNYSLGNNDLEPMNVDYLSPSGIQSTSSNNYFRSGSTITTKIPNDVFTEQPFIYAKVGDSYTLTYTMHFTPPTQSSGSDYAGYADTIKMMFVDGTNTATPETISKEGANNPALSSAQMKARDSQRKSDLSQIRTGLALFYDDHTAKYPYTTTVGVADQSNNKDGQGAIGKVLINSKILIPTYLSRALEGPTADGKAYDRYFYLDDRLTATDTPKHYALYTMLETNGGLYYYVVNDEGTTWGPKDVNQASTTYTITTKTEPPTCVAGRTPVCGYAQ